MLYEIDEVGCANEVIAVFDLLLFVDDDIDEVIDRLDEIDEVDEVEHEVPYMHDEIIFHFNEVRDEVHDAIDDDEVEGLDEVE